MRPGRLLAITSALQDAVADKGNPSGIYIGVAPLYKSSFWDIPATGFGRAKQELGCLGDFVMPPDRTQPADVIIVGASKIVSDFIARPASGIAVGTYNVPTMMPLVQQARSQNIPVISFDTDCPSSGRLLLVAADSQPAGLLAGQKMLALIGPNTGKVVVLGGISSGPNAAVNMTLRLQGVVDAFTAVNRQAQIVVPNADTGNTTEAIVDAALDTVYASGGGTSIVGVIATSGSIAAYIPDWISKNGLTGTVKVVVWDISSTTQTLLASGGVDAILAQQAYFYGFLPTYILYAMAVIGVDKTMALLAPYLGGAAGDFLDTGMLVVTTDNVADYAAYQSTCLGIGG